MLTIEDCTLLIQRAASAAILAVAPSVAQVERTLIEGGASLQNIGATVYVTNSVFRSIGASSMPGALTGTGRYELSFSTIIDTFVDCGSQGATNVLLDSSVLYNSSQASGDVLKNASERSVSYLVAFPQSGPLGSRSVSGMSPRLVDVAAGNYRLQSSSPAIDRGNPSSTLPVDFERTERPQGAGRDSGAFEYKAQ